MRLPFSVLGVALPGEIRNSASRGVCGSLPRPKIRPPRSLRDCARASAGNCQITDRGFPVTETKRPTPNSIPASVTGG